MHMQRLRNRLQVENKRPPKKAWTMVGTSYLLRLRLPSLLSAKYGISSAKHRANLGYARNDSECDGLLLALNVGNWQRQIHSEKNSMLGTTVLCVRKDHTVVIIGDGQVTIGSEIVKPNVRKVRKIGENAIGGFAGATADAFTLFEKLESQLEEHSGQLTRAAVELAKTWRTDKFLRRLDAVMVVADSDISLTITGNGDVLEPHDGIIAIGSGGPYAVAAARALIDVPNMDAEAIARKAMKIAADSCIYTNHNFTIEKISSASEKSPVVDTDTAIKLLPDNEHVSGTPSSTPAISTTELCTEVSKTSENNRDNYPTSKA